MAGLVPDSWGLGYLTDFTRPRSNTLLGLSAGLLSGDLSNAPLYAMEGKKVDDAYATAEKEKAAAAAQLNQTIEFLRQTAPKYAEAVQAGVLTPGDAYKMFIADSQPQAAAAQPAAVQEYEYYKQQAIAAGQQPLSWLDYQTQRGGQSEISLTPTWGIDTDQSSPTFGKMVLGQLGKDNKFHRTDMGGVQPVDPATMAASKTGGVTDAKTAGAARAALPSAESAYQLTEQALANFDVGATGDAAKSVKEGMSENFGKIAGIYPQQWAPILPGTNRANFQNVVDQLSGQAFLNIRQALKGAGQVTDYEGAKGEIALSRMSAAAKSGDEVAFKQALQDFKVAIDNGMRLLRETAQGGYSAGAPNVTGPSGNQTSTGVQWSYTP